MNEVDRALDGLDEVAFDDLKARYIVAVKMVFALTESIDECAPDRVERDISRMFRSLIGDGAE